MVRMACWDGRCTSVGYAPGELVPISDPDAASSGTASEVFVPVAGEENIGMSLEQ